MLDGVDYIPTLLVICSDDDKLTIYIYGMLLQFTVHFCLKCPEKTQQDKTWVLNPARVNSLDLTISSPHQFDF